MKYIPFIMILFVSCQMAPDFTYSTKLPEGVNSLESAFLYTSSFTYTLDSESHGAEEYWQAPAETVDRGTGDCEDFAILFSAMAQELGHDADMIITDEGHALSVIDGVRYDPTPILSGDGWTPAEFVPDTSGGSVANRFTVDEVIQRAIEKYGSY